MYEEQKCGNLLAIAKHLVSLRLEIQSIRRLHAVRNSAIKQTLFKDMKYEAYLPFGHHTIKTVTADGTDRKPGARIDHACFTAISTNVFPSTALALRIRDMSQT